MYQPPPTDAMMMVGNGMLVPAPPGSLLYFSSDSDVEKILPLMKALDPDTQLYDGSGVSGPVFVYGADGRKLNNVRGTINGLAYDTAIGSIVAQQFYGPMWNGMQPPPYTKLVANEISGLIEIVWGH